MRAGAIYQKVITHIFHDLMHNIVEDYEKKYIILLPKRNDVPSYEWESIGKKWRDLKGGAWPGRTIPI